MLSHLDRKLLRDLRRMTGQAVAVSLVMACGLAMLIMARSLIDSLETTRAGYYQANHFAEIFASLKRAPNDLSTRIAALPGVATVQTGLAVPVTLDLPGLAEPEVVRHYVRLSQKNYAIDSGLYPLGSCTMKHNPRLSEKMARLPGFGDIHPLQPATSSHAFGLCFIVHEPSG